KVIDIGSGAGRRGRKIVNLDIFRWPEVDVVFDGRHLPIRDASIDGIISIAVLEHVEEPGRLVAEMFRVLKEGGKFLITVPFLEGYHESPSDFQRYTLRGLEVLFQAFVKVESGVECGPSSALAWIFRGWLASFGRTRRSHALLMFIGGWLVQPLKYVDIFLASRPFALRVAAGLFFVGEKPPGEVRLRAPQTAIHAWREEQGAEQPADFLTQGGTILRSHPAISPGKCDSLHALPESARTPRASETV
ncbi:MAG: class I SAM-dependent methyltransferase, partial [Dehalococcoidia bacterium]|nr:class I SAM-dependent methyltransferase [Dehalococcoidia bacterium]